MNQLDEALTRLMAHDGVERILLVDRDGLLIRHLGDPSPFAVDAVAAMIPGLTRAGAALGRAAEKGGLSTLVVELAAGVAVVAALSNDLFLGVFVGPGVGFAPLLRDLRGERDLLARLL